MNVNAVTYVTIPQEEYSFLRAEIAEIHRLIKKGLLCEIEKPSGAVKDMYTRKEMAEILRITTRKLDIIIRRGDLQSTKIGGSVRIVYADYMEYLNRQRNMGMKRK